MTASRARRKQIELAAKVTGLRAEFAYWQEIGSATGELREYRTRILAITRPLALLLDRLAQAADDPVEDWVATESRIVGLHQIWDYFREKLTLRHLSFAREFLDLADDLAWSCYAPALAAAGPAAPVEPPLVHLARTGIPFALPRGWAFGNAVDPSGSGLRSDELREAVRELPVSVIGVPWLQLGHLPEAVVVAHEVGHLVLDDLGLADPLRAAVVNEFGGGNPQGAAARYWLSVLHEACADLYGVLALGPGYALALCDFAATRPGAATPAGYPPIPDRISLTADALTVLGLSDQAEAVRTRWQTEFADYPALKNTTRFTALMLNSPLDRLGGRTLASLFPTAEHHTAADRLARALLDHQPLPQATPDTLVAACALAFSRSPERYHAQQSPTIPARALKHFRAHRQRGPRAETPLPPATPQDQAEAIWHHLTRAANRPAPAAADAADAAANAENPRSEA